MVKKILEMAIMHESQPKQKTMATAATCELSQYLRRIAIKYEWCVRYCIS